VINASVPGYGTYQASRWYTREVDGYEHDVLIIYLGWNDIAQFNPDGLAFKLNDQGYLPQPNLFQKAIIGSYVLRSLYVLAGYWERSKPVSQEALSASDERRYREFYPSHYEELLRNTIALARSRGRHVLLLNFASLISDDPTAEELARMHFPRGMRKSLPKYRLLMAAYLSALEKVARETDTTLVDIAAAFDTPERRKTFSDSVHYDRDGSERIAALVADALRLGIEQAGSP
jgi:lysophospholipase L1-like esterase